LIIGLFAVHDCTSILIEYEVTVRVSIYDTG